MGTDRVKKNLVSVENLNGMLRLRFRHEGKRYSLSLGLAATKMNHIKAESVARQIELDKLTGHFDSTLEKYGKQREKIAETMPSLITSFDTYLSRISSTYHHTAVRSWIKRDKVEFDSLVAALTILSNTLARDTWKKRQRIMTLMLETLGEYSELKGKVLGLKYTRNNQQSTTRLPFTLGEIRNIIESIATHHTEYTLFTQVLFVTGARVSEVIGLRKRDLSEDFSNITISSSLVRVPGQHVHNTRVRKSTKTGTIRILKVPCEIAALIEDRASGLSADDLLFTVDNRNIEDQTYLKRVWKPTIKRLGLNYRVPYAARHTMASRGLASGLSAVEVAHLLGHSSPFLVLERYAHLVSNPSLPSI